jgi:hypothetical protein
MTEFMCQALDFYGATWCGRCRLNWTTGVSNAPKCKPKADPPIGISEMYTTLTHEAKRLTDSQAVCIAAKFRTEPYQPEMRKAAVMIAAAQLLEQVYRDERIMQLLKAGKS